MKQNKSNKIAKILLNYILPVLFAAAIFIFDQRVKNWAENVLVPQGFIPVIPGVFHLNCAYNTGAAWSMMSGQRGLLLSVTMIAMFCIAYAAFTDTLPYPRVTRWALFSVLGGALGNFFDRIFRVNGAVVDMFDFCLINFPIFNVADIFICLGGGVIILCLIIEFIKRDREFKKEQNTYEFTAAEVESFEIESADEEEERHDS